MLNALDFHYRRMVRVENRGYSVPFFNKDRFCHISSKKAQYFPMLSKKECGK